MLGSACGLFLKFLRRLGAGRELFKVNCFQIFFLNVVSFVLLPCEVDILGTSSLTQLCWLQEPLYVRDAATRTKDLLTNRGLGFARAASPGPSWKQAAS